MRRMSNGILYAPWRMDYIKGLSKPPGGNEACFICQGATAANEQDRRDRLVLWVSGHCVVMINRYPYTNGHLLVAPKAHKADLEELSSEERVDLIEQTVESVKLLKRAVSAQGFNVGINLGRPAGAGHVHQHVVPRWSGDVNFMNVVGEVKVVPQAMSQLYEELVRVRAELSH
jgi:ATP adenylyltransferase